VLITSGLGNLHSADRSRPVGYVEQLAASTDEEILQTRVHLSDRLTNRVGSSGIDRHVAEYLPGCSTAGWWERLPWCSRFFLAVLAFLYILLSTRDAQAADNGSLEPQKIVIGIYVNSITNVSLRENRFSADLYVWFRWTGKAAVDPLKNFDVANGKITARSSEVREEHKDFHYASCRVTADMTGFFDVSRFPLDDHVLRIEVEDSEKEADLIEYVADTANSGLAPGIQVPGWRISPPRSLRARNRQS